MLRATYLRYLLDHTYARLLYQHMGRRIIRERSKYSSASR